MVAHLGGYYIVSIINELIHLFRTLNYYYVRNIFINEFPFNGSTWDNQNLYSIGENRRK